MSFLYPRTIAITRPNQQTGVGELSYGGLSPNSESPILSGIPASIQLANANKNNTTAIPGDVPVSNYKIYSRAIGEGVVNDRDVVTDDLGIRYKVVSAYWDSMGVNLYCQKLEA